ncbi:uncharacterized protein LOC130636254 [Hydractinia symbiolongicarpus]|uniref:uncharacterized protein LOC130636254 n=1 Tax=Hydractinia symbiolongicarpus TaxID=13093 RepID=UPI00254FC9D4|nr:uncharacterized protein LOC130636254 [Hydractinia symbiolongicarpus]
MNRFPSVINIYAYYKLIPADVRKSTTTTTTTTYMTTPTSQTDTSSTAYSSIMAMRNKNTRQFTTKGDIITIKESLSTTRPLTGNLCQQKIPKRQISLPHHSTTNVVTAFL